MDGENKGIIMNGPDPVFEPGVGGLGFEIFRSLELNKDKTAQNFIESGESCTFKELLERSKILAIYLRKKDLKEDDVICLCSHNQMNVVLPFFAAKFIDVNYATIEPTVSEDDLKYLLDYVKPKIIFVANNVEKKIEKCVNGTETEIIVFNKSGKYNSLEEILVPIPEEKTFAPVIINDLKRTAIIFFSSGTTGKPKAICCNHYSFLSQAVNTAHVMCARGCVNLSNYSYNFGGEEKPPGNNMAYAPLYWISGIQMTILNLFLGNIHTFGTVFSSEKTWQAIRKYKPTSIFLPPGQIAELYLGWDKFNCYSELETFSTGGGPVKSTHLAYMGEMCPNAACVQLFGMTESTAIVSGFHVRNPDDLDLQKKYPSSCGRLTYGVSCKIVDIDTNRINGYNQQGELRIKSKYLMNGYFKLDSSYAFDSDGWFKTGDLAFINEDHCLTIVDRIKDILLYTVYNIRPSVIEDILAKHPAVFESFVIGIPHIKDNEHPMGVVNLKPEYKNSIKAEEIVSFVNDRVPSDRYKLRAGIIFVNEMVKTPTGKIKKIDMKNSIIKEYFSEGKYV